MTNAHARRVLCALTLAFFAFATSAQVNHWQEKNEAGNAAAQARRYADAEQLYQAAIKEAEAFGKADIRLATSLANLATVYHLQNRFPEARDAYQRSIKILEKIEPPEPLLLASTLDRLGVLYRDTSKFDQAEQCAKRTLELRISKLGNANLEVADALDNLAAIYFLQGTLVRATPGVNPAMGTAFPSSAGDISVGTRQRGMTAAEQTEGNQEYYRTHPRSPEEERKSLASLAASGSLVGLFPWSSSAAFDKGKLSKAAGNYREALDVREKLLGPDHPLVAKSLDTLAEVFMAQRDYATAAPLYLRLSGIEDKLLGPADMRHVPTLRKYSYALRAMKNNEEADKVDARISGLLTKDSRP